ncbi:MAG: dipeptidyl aminopeptidase/acylaminoacyl peptidase [Flavobacteriaceae bacterium]|jgi:dipeptidyl aminopeptidase/acylaminoacyl peptidase|tara:strand:- start:7838 stop:9856 length:2019 start_codon:yes stop_codon:yes gene_type:complete
MKHFFILLFIISFKISSFSQNTKAVFTDLDVFDLQYVKNPQISPDGSQIVYRRMTFDILKDRAVGNLWMINSSGINNQKLTSRESSEYGAIWSPNGDRLAFISLTDEGPEIYMYWKNTSKFAKISQLEGSPSNLVWSSNGKDLAFTMKVKTAPPVLVKMPKKPKGAKWAKTARITDRLYHESDGQGYIDTGFTHVFLISSEGSGIAQLTSGEFNHRGPLSWSNDNSKVYFTSNRSDSWEYDFRNSELYSVNVENYRIMALTDRKGPDFNPKESPNGKYVAYLGYNDKIQAYQNTQLSIMDTDGKNKRVLSLNVNSSINSYQWDSNNKGIYYSYDKFGDTKIAYLNLDGSSRDLAENLGGNSIGRPYGGGSFSVSNNGVIAYTNTSYKHPSELTIVKDNKSKQITNLNSQLLENRTLGKVEEIWYKSSFDNRDIQGWVVYPPNYDSSKNYPFLVENHGGPISNYGSRFSAEIQLFAAAGYVVFYPNPRGSTSYGEEFANLLHHNYPAEDYIDVMDGVDFCINKGIAKEEKLYVTGGSAGGLMTAWIVGKNNRFEAAVVVKPVMNWISKTLTADNYFQYSDTRLAGQPWDNFQEYWDFSPISLVGNIQTPTMVMVGMEDLRTPPSEAKQLYHALKLRKIPTVLVEIPEASHGIANRPSNLITKVAHVLAWLKKY